MILTVKKCHSITLTDLKLVVTGRRETTTHSETHSAAFRVITPRYERRQKCFLYKSAITGWKTARADGNGDDGGGGGPAVCSTNDEEDALTRSERQFGRGEVQTSAMWHFCDDGGSQPFYFLLNTPETTEEEEEEEEFGRFIILPPGWHRRSGIKTDVLIKYNLNL